MRQREHLMRFEFHRLRRSQSFKRKHYDVFFVCAYKIIVYSHQLRVNVTKISKRFNFYSKFILWGVGK